MFVLAILLGSVAVLTAPAGANPKAIRDFGISVGKPIDKGFVIVGGIYIDAPYTVSRRGLDIYVNEIRVCQGAGWPRPDLTVAVDPGPPPKGVKPWDMPASGKIEDNYWARKWRYLKARMTHKEAVTLMKATIEASDAFVKAEWGANPDTIVVQEADGSKIPISYARSGQRTLMEMTKEELLAMHEDYREHYEKMIRANVLLMKKEGAELYVTGKRARDALAVLLRPDKPNQKIAALEALKVLRPGDSTFHPDVRQFRASDQLRRRLARLNRESEDAKRHRQLLSSVHGLAQGIDPETHMADPAFSRPVSYSDARVQPATQITRPASLSDSSQQEAPLAKSRWMWFAAGAVLLLAVVFVLRRSLRGRPRA